MKIKSILNPNVHYFETKIIDKKDINQEKNIYMGKLYGINVVVCVGSENMDYIDESIIYTPIYLIKTNGKVVRIGIFEFSSFNKSKIFDNITQNINIQGTGNTILFSYATKEYIEENRLIPENQEEMDDVEETLANINLEEQQQDLINAEQQLLAKEDDINDIRKDIFEIIPNFIIKKLLDEEDHNIDENITLRYNQSSSTCWVSSAFKNNNYKIINTVNNSNCLFECIKIAFNSIGQDTTVDKLRQKLADSFTQNDYSKYKNIYDTFKTVASTLKKEGSALIEKYKNEKDEHNKQKILQESHNKKKEFDIAFAEFNKYKYMTNVKNLQQLQDLIKSDKFWADNDILSRFETILNIKFINLSQEEYLPNNRGFDIDDIMQCNTYPSGASSNSIFNPDYYIILSSFEKHYSLITYLNHSIFTYPEIPYGLKMLIVNKCITENAGGFSIINDFKVFKNNQQIINKASKKTHIIRNETDTMVPTVLLPPQIDTIKPTKGKSKKQINENTLHKQIQQEEKEEIIQQIPTEETITIRDKNIVDMEGNTPSFSKNFIDNAESSGLFNPLVVFVLHSTSTLLPGKGANEIIPKEDVLKYSALSLQDPKWRYILMDEYMHEFSHEGHRWLSVEHYLYAIKFKSSNNEIYNNLSLDSGNELSKYRLPELKRYFKNVKNAYISENYLQEQYKAELSKAEQIQKFKDILLLTQNATIKIYVAGTKNGAYPIAYSLMKVREHLRNK